MKASKGIRWVLTISAAIINALGVAFITTAALGTVPATAIPNVLAIVQDQFTLGQYLFALTDCGMVLIALLIILPARHGLYGVREGTIIAAVMCSNSVG